MNPSLPAIVMVFAAPSAGLPTELWQVAPNARAQAGVARSKDRAVVLLPGLKIHPLRPTRVSRPELHGWQEPGSELVKNLAPDFDVYAFGYAQIAALDAIAYSPGLRDSIANLKKAGYKDIVLIGHSAGGVIARLFAASDPDAGVTKVITVASPHMGAEAANIQIGFPRAQAPFIQSMAPEIRTASRFAPAQPKADAPMQMACVVCKLKRLNGDGLVDLKSQWPEDCRKNGVPAVLLPVSHWEAMQSAASAKVIGELARENLTKWSVDEVEKARRVLFGAPEPAPASLRSNLRELRLR